MEEVSGGRMHYMFNQVGGLKQDLPAGWLGRARQHRRPTSARRLPRARRDWSCGNEIFRAAPAASAS